MNELKRVLRDGVPIVKLKCPKCGVVGDLDDDQLHGRVSTQCRYCDYHETVDWSRYLKEGDGG